MKLDLAAMLKDDRFDELLGRPAKIRLEILAAVVSGQDSLAAIARRHGLTRAAMTRHRRKVAAVFDV